MPNKAKLTIWILALVALSNIPFCSGILTDAQDFNHYRYANADVSWQFIEVKSKGTVINPNIRTVSPEERKKLLNPGETIIYRCFSKNPLAFWRWREYLFDPRYAYPYRSYDEFKKCQQNVGI